MPLPDACCRFKFATSVQDGGRLDSIYNSNSLWNCFPEGLFLARFMLVRKLYYGDNFYGVPPPQPPQPPSLKSTSYCKERHVPYSFTTRYVPTILQLSTRSFELFYSRGGKYTQPQRRELYIASKEGNIHSLQEGKYDCYHPHLSMGVIVLGGIYLFLSPAEQCLSIYSGGAASCLYGRGRRKKRAGNRKGRKEGVFRSI